MEFRTTQTTRTSYLFEFYKKKNFKFYLNKETHLSSTKGGERTCLYKENIKM